jgi:DNA-binding NtrC family response regulator
MLNEKLIKQLIEITNQIALGEYKEARRLFELTKKDAYPACINALAEAFGLMLVRVEAREFHLKQTIDRLKKIQAELEMAKEKLARENISLRHSVYGHFSPKRIIGQSKVMQEVVEKAIRLADMPVNVLITGETGTGKELIAKILHYNGIRRDKPFIAINCTAIPETLFESELFGIEKGVATGVDRRIGRIEQANGGTLFLDEIGDMPLASQAKILRVLEERSVTRVGGTKSIPVDVRIVAATNKDLKEEVRKGRFREDLYFRIKVVHIHLPPLRERKDDIPLLLNNFLRIYTQRYGRSNMRFSKEAMQKLMNYYWPGNVRELENEVERLVALAPYNEIRPEDLSEDIRMGIPSEQEDKRDVLLDEKEVCTLAEMEKRLICRALAYTGNNKSEAARLLGITREGLRKKMQRYGLR